MLFVVASFALTVLCWGLYGPLLHEGQHQMSTVEGQYARLLPFVCVGLAYFAVGVVAPIAWLQTRGEQGHWTSRGALLSLGAGALGALGALGIVMAFTFGGKPSYVMPLVFGGAPVVNSFVTIFLARKMKEIGPMFLAGLIIVVLGAVTVLIFKPADAAKPKADAAVAAKTDSAPDPAPEGIEDVVVEQTKEATKTASNFLLQLLSIATVVVCWGTYGPTLHKGQAAMDNSKMRPLLCVGISYFVIAVLGSELILSVYPENSHWDFTGAVWSLMAGAAGALGALGIIMAFNFGGKPVYVMPLVFGGAPVVNTFFTIVAKGQYNQINPLFWAGLIMVIAGAVIVLVFAPRGGPKKPAKKPAESAEPSPA
ncbi:hypothetical protein KOR34_52180 [Posidoniimonas corsicana]|uniref:EamA-like transporter family protein n=2 Tax=Posidoniimonas corsicana TaxID=1938618 RepID=A0A5C5UT86_9BACT|nr:hypothetical protein KOR34_52180 [Posidoniimonas corsicana]